MARKMIQTGERVEIWEKNRLIAYQDDDTLYIIGGDGYVERTVPDVTNWREIEIALMPKK